MGQSERYDCTQKETSCKKRKVGISMYVSHAETYRDEGSIAFVL